MRRPWAFLVAGAIVLAACGGGGSDSKADPSKPAPVAADSGLTSPGRENVAFYYQGIRRDTDLTKLGNVSLVVTGKTAGRTAVVAIKKIGAKAYRGVQAYWFADGNSYDGLEVTERKDWAFCLEGSTPLVARTDAHGNDWYFLDSNERGVHDSFIDRVHTLRLQGWDGIFFDRGFAALTGQDDVQNKAWNKVSTCTENPIEDDATLSDAYLGMASEVQKAGLDLIMNYGVSPFDAQFPMRPDPRDPKCATREPGCRTLNDAWRSLDGVLDEAVAHPYDELWANDYRSNMLNEQMAKEGKHVVGLLTTGTMGGNATREMAYFEWARVKLFVIPLGVNTGDDHCGNPPPGTLCNRCGLYPELANITFGSPLKPEPQSLNCTEGSEIRCIWIRKYEQGMSLVNVSPATKSTGPIPLDVVGCRYVKDVESDQPLAGNECVDTISMEPGQWSGHPLVYSDKPW